LRFVLGKVDEHVQILARSAADSPQKLTPTSEPEASLAEAPPSHVQTTRANVATTL